jgi:anaerobic selenocysteine-containing dehydrogenase
MAIVYYTAKVKESRLLELPEEAQELGLQPGDEVTVRVDRNGVEANATFPPNERGLAAMREIAERQKHRPSIAGSDVVKLVRQARAGAMYGYDATE